ncbi:MAG: MFS transporter [Proteobacteria bacterium]|nr:MFS transporter [Pseudomonadota bacterium]
MRSARIIAALSFGLILSQVAIMAVPAVIVELAGQWSLDAAQVGWLGGIYFAGYAAGLPFLSGAANRMDGRRVYAISAAIAGLASFGFAFAATGFWTAIALRFMAGVGFSGIHIVGMKLLVDRLEGPARARAGAIYSAAYAIGSGGSFLIAGLLSGSYGWAAAFIAAGAGALLSLPLLLLIGPPLGGNEVRSTRWFPDFGAVLREREVMRYVIAYAGNTWEVFAIRVWFVPFLAYSAGLNGHATTGWPPSVLAGISALIAVPVSIAIAELALRFGRDRVVCLVSLASVCACLMLGWLAATPYALVLSLLLVHGATSYGDAGAINGGVISAATPEVRAAALALFGLFGFTSGFLGPLAVGLAIKGAGGVTNASAWFWGFAVMAFGSGVAAIAMTRGRA